MLKIIKGNILDDDADALVNPVNCVGVMGKGLALEFKKLFPDNFKEYKRMCSKGLYFGGCVIPVWTIGTHRSAYVVNFATKEHWKQKSKPEWIENGLRMMNIWIKIASIKSIAFPMLGCGLGGLDPYEVKILIADFSSMLPDVDVRLYE